MTHPHRVRSHFSQRVLRLLLVFSMALLAQAIGSCSSDSRDLRPGAEGAGEANANERVGTLSAALEVPGYLKAAKVHFEIKSESGEVRSADVDLLPGDFASVNQDHDGHAFADWLVVLPIGKYTVEAWLIDGDGNRIEDCPAASGEAEIANGVTTELTLTTVCKGAENGALDVGLIVNTAVGIIDLQSESGKYVCLNQAFDVELVADDPDQDALEWSFSVTGVPANAGESVYCLAYEGHKAAFSAAVPGRYELTAEVSDGIESASLSFPVYVGECGQGRCPGLLVSRAFAGSVGVEASGACQCEVPSISYSANNPPSVAVVPPVTKGEPGTRTVARYQNPVGKTVDFVDNEMLVMTDDPAELSALLARWGGEVRGQLDFASRGIDHPTVYRVAVDPSTADLDAFPSEWAIGIGAQGNHTFSSPQGAKLFAAMLSELNAGVAVAVNPILVSADFAGRSTLEEPAPEFSDYTTRDAYQWPYMNRTSEQDIGTGEAWTVLDAAGLLSNRVRVGVADGGFILNRDIPAGTLVAGPERVANPSSCTGGSPCPWHGTMVVAAGFGVPDNEIGVAGPGGPVAQLALLPSPAPDFFAYIQYIFANIPAAFASRPQIINVSAGVSMPREVCLAILAGLPACETLHGITRAFRLGGTLIFAAAGNTNEDVDALKDYVFFKDETDIILPCELDGVTCVGGLGWDSNDRHASSSFGTLPADGHSVDIFGPFDTFVIADPQAADDDLSSPNTSVAVAGGTSFSSPYVAGVASLIWAANPSLSADQVERILLDTAHDTSIDNTVPRWVNALGATLRALGRDAPPFLRITTRSTALPEGSSIRLSAVVEEIDGQSTRVEWLRDGSVFATGLDQVVSTAPWNLDSNLIQARAIDSSGNVSAVDSISVTIIPDAPPPRSLTVAPPRTGTLCPIGPERGDREFNGGPTVDFSVQLRVSPDQSTVFADIELTATAPPSDPDRSMVTERFTHVLFNTPSERIVLIESPVSMSTTFVGRGGGAEFGFCNDGTPESHLFSSVVEELVFIADTGAEDISNDGDCHCDSKIVDISFRPLQLQLVPR